MIHFLAGGDQITDVGAILLLAGAFTVACFGIFMLLTGISYIIQSLRYNSADFSDDDDEDSDEQPGASK